DELVAESKIGDNGGVVEHFHPVSFVGNMLESTGDAVCKKCGKNISLTLALVRKFVGSAVSDEFLTEFTTKANEIFPKYGVNTCSQVVHILGQG
ncbi:hypothetical protein, partial [Pseudomonas viridiflava]|uniref:hypothetical protein n=1 Tax=Pseudomonas viridiflava TaxID=33069 RepID=UPI0019D0383B